ncbi:MAG: addiction module protein [Candidatus Accumulibacter sp.]|nr:addiction module protein [Accumulibacter sp.]
MTHDDIVRMTAPERLALIGDLWDSLSEEDTPLPMPQFQELQRRMASFDRDRDRAHAVSWEHLKAELIKREHP